MRLGVVVVTYRSDDILGQCLASLRTHEPDARVVVVDDASPDGPPDPGDAALLVVPERSGFGAACNRGTDLLAQEGAQVVAFLNPDVLLTGPSLTQVARGFADRPELGIASGAILDDHGERVPSAWGPTSVRRALVFAAGYEPRRMRSAAGGLLGPRALHHEAPIAPEGIRVEGHVGGGAMIVRVSCFTDIGGFDEEFFLYWEDADLCHRAREAGWEVRLLPCDPFQQVAAEGAHVAEEDRWAWFSAGASRFGHKHLVPGQARQLEAALELGRRLARLRERG